MVQNGSPQGLTAGGMVAAILLFSLISGCAERGPHRVPVTGRITYQGRPVPDGWVSFTRLGELPQGVPSRPATGELDQDGRYSMKTFGDDDGVMPGEYAVAVVAIDYERAKAARGPGQPQPYTIPQRYTRPETSGLTVTIPEEASGALEFNFDLVD